MPRGKRSHDRIGASEDPDAYSKSRRKDSAETKREDATHEVERIAPDDLAQVNAIHENAKVLQQRLRDQKDGKSHYKVDLNETAQENEDIKQQITEQLERAEKLIDKNKTRVENFQRSQTSREYFCERCAKLDFDYILKTHNAHPVTSYGPAPDRQGQFRSHCNFCRLLLQQFQLRPSTPIKDGNWVMLFALKPLGRFKCSGDNQVLLGFLDSNERSWRGNVQKLTPETGYLCRTNSASKKMCARPIEPEKIDFQLIQKWISSCRRSHGRSCNPGPIHIEEQKMLINLINCHTGEIEQGDGAEPYAALSYVWGAPASSSNDELIVSTLPQDLPLTIEDAITVTKKLQISYLWVDRYCIPQKKCPEKNAQIRQMDKIYARAEITIVAAAGQDPNFGLPGVSTTLRIRQPRAKIGKFNFISTMSDVTKTIGDSRWISRGWTYQEAICARRLLIFTVQQVYFECQDVSNCESFTLQSPSNHHNIFKTRHWEDNPWEILQNISEYSNRNLTNHSDALNAMLGVLRRFEEGKSHTRHFWGVPILPAMIRCPQNGRPQHIQRSITDGFVAGLCWKHETGKEGQRREDFPSWSWTGWTCALRPTSVYYTREAKRVCEVPIEMSFQFPHEHGNRRRQSFEEFSASRDNQQGIEDYFSGVRDTFITALTLELQPECFKSYQPFSEDRLEFFACPASSRASSNAHVRMNILEAVEEKPGWCTANPQLMGIFMGKVDVGTNGTVGHHVAFVMVIKEIRNGVYERIGYIELSSTVQWLVESSTLAGRQTIDNPRNKSIEECEHLKPWFEAAAPREIRLR
ncbi:MAG: hypothetical protein Q9227_008544 [Pyrenula ochraceoflavens]